MSFRGTGAFAPVNPESQKVLERNRYDGPMSCYVQLLASKKDGVLYLGVTNDLIRRVYEHKSKATPGFTSRYNVALLVWFEVYDDPIQAITREKEIKKWRRAWKVSLIAKENPGW